MPHDARQDHGRQGLAQVSTAPPSTNQPRCYLVLLLGAPAHTARVASVRDGASRVVIRCLEGPRPRHLRPRRVKGSAHGSFEVSRRPVVVALCDRPERGAEFAAPDGQPGIAVRSDEEPACSAARVNRARSRACALELSAVKPSAWCRALRDGVWPRGASGWTSGPLRAGRSRPPPAPLHPAGALEARADIGAARLPHCPGHHPLRSLSPPTGELLSLKNARLTCTDRSIVRALCSTSCGMNSASPGRSSRPVSPRSSKALRPRSCNTTLSHRSTCHENRCESTSAT